MKQVSHLGTTFYIGSLFEKVTGTGGSPLVENRHYIMAPTGRVAVYVERNDSTHEVQYFHTDGLGSITAVTNELGQVVKRFAFDAWGKRFDVDLSTYATTLVTSANNYKVTRGFTDHEHLDDLGLIHMNGRVYDPVLGRFLSADPYVGDVGDSQEYNRYSYVGNNPLNATDPSGYFKLWKDALGPIVQYVATAIAYYYCGPYTATLVSSAIGATINGTKGAIQGAVASWGYGVGGPVGYSASSAFSGSLLNGGSIGDAFKAGVIGGAQAYFAGKIGDHFGDVGSWQNELGRAVAHGALGGAVEEARGGQFRHGFYAGAVGSLAGSVVGSTALGEIDGPEGMALRTAISAVAGGTASVLGGGKFANGALTAAFQHLFNVEAHRGFMGKVSRFFGGDPDGGFLGTSLTSREFFGAAGQGAKSGYYAWADGLNPFGDFYADMGYYDTNDSALQWSQRFGGLSGAAGSSLLVVGGGGMIAARGGFTLSRHVAGQIGAGERYWSETAVRQAFGSGRAMLNTGEGVGKLLSTVKYSVGNGGAVVRNVFTNKIVHYLPKW